MHIVADENLSLTDYFFSAFGSVTSIAGRGMQAGSLVDAEALLVRSVTQVTPKLLQDAANLSETHKHIGFVGSATIGMDHLDVAGLHASGVTVANAPGCNAQAVAEYVVTAILTLHPERAMKAGFTLGIIGLGNVGQRLARLARRLNWRVIGVDPFIQRADITQMAFAEMLPQVDAISLHVPLTQGVADATFHLIDYHAFETMHPDTLLINSARGAVVQESALIADFARARAQNKPIRSVVLDVFEHEPHISATLLADLALATPHIAGYSLEGKARGTEMVYQAFCQWQDMAPRLTLAGQLPEMPELFDSEQCLIEQLPLLLPEIYPIRQDDAALRACVPDVEGMEERVVNAHDFDRLRKNYPLRREWASYGDIA